MDQVTMADIEGTMGIGNFRYAIVFCKLAEDYWRFIPLQSGSFVSSANLSRKTLYSLLCIATHTPLS